MSNGRISMHTQSSNSMPYVKFDAIVNFRPTKGNFNIYVSSTGESKEMKSIGGAFITRRNVVLAASKDDIQVTSQDFDNFGEKLFFREIKKGGGKIVAKDITYSEAKDNQHLYFLSNSFRLASVLYLVTDKGSVIRVILTGTTRAKVNEQLDNFESIDYITLNISEGTVSVGTGSRKQDVYEIEVKEEKKEYKREVIDKINDTVNTLKSILEYKKKGNVETADSVENITEDDVSNVFNTEDADNLPI